MHEWWVVLEHSSLTLQGHHGRIESLSISSAFSQRFQFCREGGGSPLSDRAQTLSVVNSSASEEELDPQFIHGILKTYRHHCQDLIESL